MRDGAEATPEPFFAVTACLLLDVKWSTLYTTGLQKT